ncbi:zinc-binding alcohol dehydrogenase family protein [Brooklawnia cerclae]|uniref:Zinc-type alcohol dehydrogenase-like protein n=1 Tax=Brooklawnia cerclae TaxID=349934 RepID=A0ABX0SC22_9ACTN|nr:zinc-binding alcohol dehydrogenase family protein [Brooklawnia cerclae]NIH55484.1 zinc-binding alcohol dehydrogenase family protein [Brooklawnia cerclae]
MTDTVSLPATMRVVGMPDSLPIEDPRSLVDDVRPVPQPGPRDLLVEVAAVSVNPVDIKRRTQWGPQDPPRILGWDAVGTVRALGADVAGFGVGDRVFYAGDLTRPGTDAEYHLVDERLVARAPSSLDDARAAAVPLTALTAWEGLFDRLGVAEGASGTLLVVGAAGGVGSLVMQLARRLTSLTVVATASRPESREWCLGMGAHYVVDHSLPLAEQVLAIDPGGAQYVYSTHTQGREADIAQAMAPQSHFLLIDDPETFDARVFKVKSIAIHWESMFTRSTFKTPDMGRQGEILARVAELLDAGGLRTTLGRRLEGLDAATLREAHRLIETGRSIGKVVVVR